MLQTTSGFEARSDVRFLPLGKGKYREGGPARKIRQGTGVGKIHFLRYKYYFIIPLKKILQVYRS